jgi:hypothetical protein
MRGKEVSCKQRLVNFADGFNCAPFCEVISVNSWPIITANGHQNLIAQPGTQLSDRIPLNKDKNSIGIRGNRGPQRLPLQRAAHPQVIQRVSDLTLKRHQMYGFLRALAADP